MFQSDSCVIPLSNILTILIFFCRSTTTSLSSTISQGVNGTDINVVSGHSATLPCDTKQSSTREQPSLILWFKEEDGKPIFSVDVNGLTDLSFARIWSSPNHFGNRAMFKTKDRISSILIVTNIQQKEAGLYRCRVDFRDAPSSNSFVNLNVIVEPKQIAIFDENWKERNTFVGPYLEGENMKLICQAIGGLPSPSVSWLKNGIMMDVDYQKLTNNTVRNILQVNALTRTDLHSEYTCSVTNNNISNPITNTIHLDMNFPPATVSIDNIESVVLVVGSRVDIMCHSGGSRPHASITWWIDNENLQEGSHETSSLDGNGNRTQSILQFTPAMRHIGKTLRCKASNSQVPGKDIFADWHLNISYAPNVELVLGKSISADSIYEGGDVYFDCRVNSSPPPDRVYWYHNGVQLNHSPERGIIFTNFSLVLQKISQSQAGAYMCESSNRVGKGRSEDIILDVKYVPICASPEPVIYGVSKNELVNIVCKVEANPSEVQFKWTFNNSAELIRVNNRAASEGSISKLTYTPQNTMDYGTLLCSASNTVGEQRKPCVFHIIMAVAPEPVENCSVINKSSDTFHIKCVPGFDGGMNQTFHILVRDRLTNIIKYDNASLDKPELIIEHLDAGVAYIVAVIAINKKGASPAVYKTVETLQQPELQLIEEKIPVQAEMADSELVLGVGVGVAVCVTVLIIVGVAIRHSSCGRRRGQSLLQTEYRPSSSREYGLGSDGSTSGIMIRAGGGEEECMQSLQRKSILKNKPNCDSSPDIIPHHDHENWNFLVDGVQRDPPEDCDSMMQHNNVNTEPFREDEELEFPHKKSSAPGASILSLKSGSRDGLLLLTSSDCEVDDGSGQGMFPSKISTSTLKRGSSCKRTFLLKEKRESIV